MFLSKRSNGMYYIFYDQSNGKRTCISTKSKNKSQAIKFLSEFQSRARASTLGDSISIDLKTFSFDYLKFSENYHRPKTQNMLKIIFEQFKEYLGNPILNEINSQDCELFNHKKTNVSKHTAQKYLAYLRAAFNKAIVQGFIIENPFRKVRNFKIPERLPNFFLMFR